MIFCEYNFSSMSIDSKNITKDHNFPFFFFSSVSVLYLPDQLYFSHIIGIKD